MLKRFIHIAVTAILALNLSGAAAFSYATDCDMECCRPADWAGTSSFEAPSCCDMDGVTCGFETGRLEDLFDTVLTRFNTTDSTNHLFSNLPVAVNFYAPTHPRTYTLSFSPNASPSAIPLYLFNAAILC